MYRYAAPSVSEERAPVVVHSELAIAEDGGMVFEEGLKEALALEELADLEEGEGLGE